MKLRNGNRFYTDRLLDINPKATLAIAQHNASSSPLLRLPLELKMLIYQYTFGGNLIHIIQRSNSKPIKFRNTICRALISEEEAQANFDHETIHQWYCPANEDRHKRCRYQKKRASISNEEQRPQMLSLSALRCCRQMYNEAHYVPYSANTFSCAHPDTLHRFVLSLGQGSNSNHLAIRSLFFEVPSDMWLFEEDAWTKAINTCAKKCKNLKNANISFESGAYYWTWELSTPGEFIGSWHAPFMSDILALKELPLKSATFVISDAQSHDKSTFVGSLSGPARWSLEEKKELARYVKERILE